MQITRRAKRRTDLVKILEELEKNGINNPNLIKENEVTNKIVVNETTDLIIPRIKNKTGKKTVKNDGAISIEKAYADYEESLFNSGKKRQTIHGYRFIRDNVLYPFFNNQLKMNDLRKFDIEDTRKFIDYVGKIKNESGEQYSRKTLVKYFGRLRNIFDVMVENGHIKYNPIQGSFPMNVGQIYHKQQTIIKPEDFVRFISKVDIPGYKLLFSVLYMTGLRIGEVVGLKWDSVDFENNLVYIVSTVSKHILKEDKEKGITEYVDVPKTASSVRVISIRGKLKDQFQEFYNNEIKKAGFNDECYIFGFHKHYAQTTITDKKNRWLKDSGLQHMTNHDFRHSCATTLYLKNVPSKTIQALLGHASDEFTKKVYIHSDKLQAVNAIADIMTSLLNEAEQVINDNTINKTSVLNTKDIDIYAKQTELLQKIKEKKNKRQSLGR